MSILELGSASLGRRRTWPRSDRWRIERNDRDSPLPGILDGLKLLLLEDHADTRESLAVGLRGYGADVVEADSAQAALLLVESHHPDLLVVDIELPEVDGWSFLRALRKLPRESGGRTPAVALTVHNEPEDRRRSILSGFRLHLAKPMTAGQLAGKVETLLSLSQHSSQPR